jgi:alkylhydroperoxidase family enzyme
MNRTSSLTGLAAGQRPPLFAPLSDDDAWKALPPVESGGEGVLPSWARLLARSLPRTTAALLRLDLAHRTRSPLDPKLRAAIRWIVAAANGSPYGKALADFDARRAGLPGAKLAALEIADLTAFSREEQEALEFARKMTVESSKITDEEFASLVRAFGENQVAAMVLLTAYANFQDRLLLVLGAPVESDGPLPPMEVVFKPESFTSHTAPAAPPIIPDLPEPTGIDAEADADTEWKAYSYEDLQRKLAEQRSRPARLRVPSYDEVMKGLPPGTPLEGRRIAWTLVAFGYCPELAEPWETLMWINGAENGRRLDRVLGLGLFWIVTRTIDCPYCMGHVEMNWEVIGMTPKQIADRSRALAGSNWSSFPEREQNALSFARKITATPSEVSLEDVRRIVNDFGADAAVSLLTYICRCNYMVRVSNGFQLALERDNVFFDYYGVQPRTPATEEVMP